MKTLCDLVYIHQAEAEAIRKQTQESLKGNNAAAVAKALADPTRLQIATALAAGGELCGCDLAWITRQSQNLVAHHLRLLKAVDLVESRRDGKLVFNSLTGRGSRLLSSLFEEKTKAAQ